jgi:hypothetical protein
MDQLMHWKTKRKLKFLENLWWLKYLIQLRLIIIQKCWSIRKRFSTNKPVKYWKKLWGQFDYQDWCKWGKINIIKLNFKLIKLIDFW